MLRLAGSLAAFVLLLVTPLGAFAQQGSPNAPPTRERVRALLSGIEDVPGDADWRALGEGVLPILIDLYTDRNEPPFVRLRAVGATAAFPQPATRTFLLAVARAEGQSPLFVREALNALARGFGRTAVSEIASFLGHEERIVRDAAVRALGRVGGEQARSALRARLSAERDTAVRESIRAALGNSQ